MTFSIIPEYSAMQSTLALRDEYQVGFEYNDFWNPKVYEDEGEVARRIAYYKSLPIDQGKNTLHGCFLGLDITAEDSVVRQRSRYLYRQSLEIAKELGVKGVVFHTGLIGTLTLKNYVSNWIRETRDFFKQMCEEYPTLTIYLENTFEQGPQVFVRLMEQMQRVDNFKLCLDYAHGVLTPTPIEEWCRALAPYVAHMHLNDNDLKEDLHQVPGQGKIDFAKWKDLMERYQIDTSVLLEITGHTHAKEALSYMQREGYLY